MKFYFGEVDRADAEEYGFQCFNSGGKLFDYSIEFTTGDVTIRDSCSRIMPMCWEGIAALTSLLNMYSDEIANLHSSLIVPGGLLTDETDALVAEV